MGIRDLFFMWAGMFSTMLLFSALWLSGLTDDEEVCTVERIEEEDDDGGA